MIHEQPTRNGYYDQALLALRGYRRCCYQQLAPDIVGEESIARIDSLISTTIVAVVTAEETVGVLMDKSPKKAKHQDALEKKPTEQTTDEKEDDP